MSTTATTTTAPNLRQQTQAITRPSPLLSVMTWELRRFVASNLFWAQAIGFFCLVFVMMWIGREPTQFGNQIGNVSVDGFVAGTSAWGLLQLLPVCLLVLALILPFITADGVTRDQMRRTHELLMTTALPSWAYVWGRFLTGLLVSLGLAALMLASILGMGVLLHLTIPEYPLPQFNAVLPLWFGMVLPAVILLSSVSFALATLFPGLSTLIKVVIMVGWIVGELLIPTAYNNTPPPAWYVNWDPTSAVTGRGLLIHYSPNLNAATSSAQMQHILLAAENTAPTLSGWFGPHLLLGAVSLLLVLVVALLFKRSRETLSA